MILPGTANFIGVTETTFDASVSFYNTPSETTEDGNWSKTINYNINEIVIGESGVAFKSLKPSTNQKPESNKGTFWEELTPVNMSAWTGKMKVTKGPELTGGSGLTFSTTGIAIEMTPAQTKTLTGNTHFSLVLKEPSSSKEYEYLSGSIAWQEQ